MFSCLGVKDGVDIDKFVERQLEILDKNNDEKIDFDEFVDCYNNLMDLI